MPAQAAKYQKLLGIVARAEEPGMLGSAVRKGL